MYNRKIKRAVMYIFSCLCIAVGLLCLILKLTENLPNEIFFKGLLFGLIGVVMLTVAIKFPLQQYQPSHEKASSKAHKEAQSKEREKAQNNVHKKAQGKEHEKAHYCPYPSDPTKPYGSKENPVVVGMPEYSTVLVHDVKGNRWILTDGLGNGWIR